jgi:hypothetical protein
MGSVPANVALFFGRVDKRPQSWYWTARLKTEKPLKALIAGPFETKADAVEDAIQTATDGLMIGHRGSHD